MKSGGLLSAILADHSADSSDPTAVGNLQFLRDQLEKSIHETEPRATFSHDTVFTVLMGMLSNLFASSPHQKIDSALSGNSLVDGYIIRSTIQIDFVMLRRKNAIVLHETESKDLITEPTPPRVDIFQFVVHRAKTKRPMSAQTVARIKNRLSDDGYGDPAGVDEALTRVVSCFFIMPAQITGGKIFIELDFCSNLFILFFMFLFLFCFLSSFVCLFLPFVF